MNTKEKIKKIAEVSKIGDFAIVRAASRKFMSAAPVGVGNIKTKTVSTYKKVGDSCPSDCSFLNNGCYAETGNTAIHQRKEKTREEVINAFLLGLVFASVNEMPLRIHVSGDFYINDELDVEYIDSLWTIINEAIEVGIKIPPIWTYTHRYDKRMRLIEPWIAIRKSDVDAPTGAIVVDSFEEHKRTKNQILCPNQIDKNISCKKCTLCWTKMERTIVFQKTKTSKKKK